MSAIETRQMFAAEAALMFSVEARHMFSVATGRCPQMSERELPLFVAMCAVERRGERLQRRFPSADGVIVSVPRGRQVASRPDGHRRRVVDLLDIPNVPHF